MLKNKKIILTGGAGFIGSNIARSLFSDNEVVVIDNMITGRNENISDMTGHIKFIRDDINNLDMLRVEFQSADYVLHLAALPSVHRSFEDPIFANKNNLDGTLSVLVAAKDCGVRRVVFASSSAIYGDSIDMPLRETATPRPLSPYAVTKLASEHYCRVFHEVYGMETVALRYFNVFGPGQNPSSEYAAVIPKFINAIKTGRQPVIYGDGEQTRDFVFVADVVRASILACQASNAAGKTFNIATGKATSLNRLLNAISLAASTRIIPIYSDSRSGDIRDSLADISLARRILGYAPEVRIEDGLRALLC